MYRVRGISSDTFSRARSTKLALPFLFLWTTIFCTLKLWVMFVSVLSPMVCSPSTTVMVLGLTVYENEMVTMLTLCWVLHR